jgi:hypothetical protein
MKDRDQGTSGTARTKNAFAARRFVPAVLAVPLVPFLFFAHLLSCYLSQEAIVGVKKTGKGRRKIGRKKRRMRARIRHKK